jgi:hypothetical protein
MNTGPGLTGTRRGLVVVDDRCREDEEVDSLGVDPAVSSGPSGVELRASLTQPERASVVHTPIVHRAHAILAVALTGAPGPIRHVDR